MARLHAALGGGDGGCRLPGTGGLGLPAIRRLPPWLVVVLTAGGGAALTALGARL